MRAKVMPASNRRNNPTYIPAQADAPLYSGYPTFCRAAPCPVDLAEQERITIPSIRGSYTSSMFLTDALP